MAISFSTTTTSLYSGIEIEGSFTRGIPFAQTVGVTIPSTENESFTITSIDVVKLHQEGLVTVTTTTNDITFQGTYVAGFEDEFKYVFAGESDKSSEPITTSNPEAIPNGQDLYSLDQDQNHFIEREYEVTASYTSSLGNEGEETGILTHELFNSLEFIRSFMANYDYGQGRA